MDETLNGISANLLDELASEINAIEILKPDDITVDRLMEKSGRKRCFVTRFLADKVLAKELVCVTCRNPDTGKRLNAYRAP